MMALSEHEEDARTLEQRVRDSIKNDIEIAKQAKASFSARIEKVDKVISDSENTLELIEDLYLDIERLKVELSEKNDQMVLANEVMETRFGTMADEMVVPEYFGFQRISNAHDSGLAVYAKGDLRLAAVTGVLEYDLFSESNTDAKLRVKDAMDLGYALRLMGRPVSDEEVTANTLGEDNPTE